MRIMNNLFDRTNKQSAKVTAIDSQLSLTEIEVLMNILRDSTFKVKDIEILYKTLIKLQKQHEELAK